MSVASEPRRRRENSRDHPGYALGELWGPERARAAARGRPFVYVNAAISADGKLAPATRQFEPFGGPIDGRLLYELRGYADAILCGARTMDLNAFDLDSGGPVYTRWRRRRGMRAQPLRVIVSGRASVDPRAAVFQRSPSGEASTLLLTTASAERERVVALRKVVDAVWVCGDVAIDWPSALRRLKQEWGIRRLLSEGGGELNGALFEAGVVDALYLTWCPVILGGRVSPTLADGGGFPTLREATRLELERRKSVGQEVFMRFRARAAHEPARSRRGHGGVTPRLGGLGSPPNSESGRRRRRR